MRRRRGPSPLLSKQRAVAAGLTVGGALVLGFALLGSYEIAGGIVVLHVLLVPSLLMLAAVVRREPDPVIHRILLWAFVLKMFSAVVRYGVIFEVYGGVSDARGYADIGALLAPGFRQGNFAGVIADVVGTGSLIGTHFIQIVTGIVFAFTGSTMLGGFFVYSWLGFWGAYLCYRGFVIALPEGDQRRYAALVLFLPSLLFWPSSIGKDAWMLFALGVTIYGAARLLSGRTLGAPIVVLGCLGTSAVRPHITLAVLFALAPAYLLSRRPSRQRVPLVKLAGFVLLLAGAVAALSSVQGLFTTDEQAPSIGQVLEITQERTTTGGSEFAPVGTQSPLELPVAMFSVLFRPLPFEVGSPLAFIVALEGLLLLVLTVRAVPRLRYLVRRRPAFAVFTALYTLLFAVAFSNIGNFGILARQRVQMLPFFLVLLALPPVERWVDERQNSSTSPSPRRKAGGRAGPVMVR